MLNYSEIMGNVVKLIKEKLNINIVMDKQIQLFGILNLKMGALNLIFLLCHFYLSAFCKGGYVRVINAHYYYYYIYRTKMMEGYQFLVYLRKK